MVEKEEGGEDVKLVRDGGFLQIATSIAVVLGAISGAIVASNTIAAKGPLLFGSFPDWAVTMLVYIVLINVFGVVVEVFRFAIFGGKFSIIKTFSQCTVAAILIQWYEAIHFGSNVERIIFIAIAVSFFIAWDKVSERLNEGKANS